MTMTPEQIAQALRDGSRYQNATMTVYLSRSGCYVAWPHDADPFEMSERHAIDFILAYDLQVS